MRDQIASLYGAAGYHETPAQRPDLLRLIASDDDRESPVVTIYLPLLSPNRPSPEAAVAEIVSLRAAEPQATIVVALDNPLAFGPSFQSHVIEAGAAFRTYASLMDGVYGGDAIGLGGKRGAADRLRKALVNYGRVDPDLLSAVVRKSRREAALNAPPTRARQRFFQRDGVRPTDRIGAGGGDLLTHLAARFAQPPAGPEVYLVVGPGGSGKSFFFEALFTYLDEAFQKAKESYLPGVRPVPVMPESLLFVGARRSRDLFDAVARTEYGAVGGLGLLTHQVNSGANFLMFDGLDEYFAGSGDLGEDIARRFFVPGGRARIVIVLRDSLLDTSAAVRSMAQRFAEELDDRFFVYELALWDDGDGAAQRELAWLKLHNRRPSHAEPDTEEVKGFFAALEQDSPRVRQLCQLAFYCDVMIDLYRRFGAGGEFDSESGRRMPQDEFDLLGLCYERILDREIEKLRPGDEDAVTRAFAAKTAGQGSDDVAPIVARPPLIVDAGGASYANYDRLLTSAMSIEKRRRELQRESAREELESMVEEAAYLFRRGGADAALSAERLKDLYEEADLSAKGEDRSLGQRIFRQFVLFEQGETDGAVGFTHDFMADFLAARFVVKMVESGRGDRATLSGAPARGETEIFNGYLDRELGRA